MYDYTTLKKRLQEKTAKKLFCSVDDLTQEQMILIDNQAWELAGIHAEKELSEQRIAKAVAERLQPETADRPKPAHTIIQAMPTKKIVELTKKDSFIYETTIGNIYLSSLYPVKLFKGKIKYKIAKHIAFEEANKLALNFPLSIHPSECWLGIALADGIDNLAGGSLFFDWDAADLDNRQLLDLVAIYNNERRLAIKVGLTQPIESIPIDYREELWMRNVIEEPIKNYYKNHFLTFTDAPLFPNTEQEGFPLELEAHFTKGNEKIYWLKLIFPIEVTPDMLKSCSMNCFPVLNRKLIHTEKQVEGEELIIPLIDQMEEKENLFPSYFMCLHQVHSVAQTFKPTFTEYFSAAPIGTYQLIHGRGQTFDLMDAKTQVADFIRLLHDKRTIMMEVFQLEKRNDLDKVVKELGRKIHDLEERLSTRTITRPYYFVKLKTTNRVEPVFVYYWVTQGEGVNDDLELVDDGLSFENTSIKNVNFLNKNMVYN